MRKNTRPDTYHALFLGIFISAFTIPASRAQQVCSEDEVRTSLQQLSCVADGLYISPTALVTDIQDDCSDEVTQDECYRCYRRALKRTVKPFKALVRAGRVPRSFIDDLRTATFNAADASCASLEDSSGNEDDELPDQSGADNNRGLLPNPNSDQREHQRGPREGQREGGRRHGR